jgi:hypothetical protein
MIRMASSALLVFSTSPRSVCSGTSFRSELQSPAATIQASGSSSNRLSISRRTSKACPTRFIDERK